MDYRQHLRFVDRTEAGEDPVTFEQKFTQAILEVGADRHARAFRGISARPIRNGKHYSLEEEGDALVFICPENATLQQMIMALHSLLTNHLKYDKQEWDIDGCLIERKMNAYKNLQDKKGLQILSVVQGIRSNTKTAFNK